MLVILGNSGFKDTFMRLAILGMYHETNTFSSVSADYDSFDIYRGQEIIKEYAKSHTTVAGYLACSDEANDIEVVPLFFAITGPIGTITKEAYDRITGEMLSLIEDRGPWDGILLALHGAAVSEEFPDADGEITRRVRTMVGPDIPVGLSIDMHANVSPIMVENADVTTVYRTNPHLDPRERSLECASLIIETIKGNIAPLSWLETPPLTINIVRQFTDEEPMLSVLKDLHEVLEKPGLIHGSVAQGYPYADVEEMGMSFLTIVDINQFSDRDDALRTARETSQWMARRAWERRKLFIGETPSPREALTYADEAYSGPERGPIILMDVGDNIGGGSSADSTYVLTEAKRLKVKGYLQTLYDPECVQLCIKAGVGASIILKVGGKTDNFHGDPVTVSGTIRTLFDGKFEDEGPTHGGFRFYDGGPTAVLDTDDEHTLVLTSLRCGNTSREQMYSAGVTPERYRVILAKGVVSPRPAYAPIAQEIVLVNSPGITTSDLSFFKYHRRRHKLYPFEEAAHY